MENQQQLQGNCQCPCGIFSPPELVFHKSYRINIWASFIDLFGSYSEEEEGNSEMGGGKCSLVSWLRYLYVLSYSVNCAYTLDSNVKTGFI